MESGDDDRVRRALQPGPEAEARAGLVVHSVVHKIGKRRDDLAGGIKRVHDQATVQVASVEGLYVEARDNAEVG